MLEMTCNYSKESAGILFAFSYYSRTTAQVHSACCYKWLKPKFVNVSSLCLRKVNYTLVALRSSGDATSATAIKPCGF